VGPGEHDSGRDRAGDGRRESGTRARGRPRVVADQASGQLGGEALPAEGPRTPGPPSTGCRFLSRSFNPAGAKPGRMSRLVRREQASRDPGPTGNLDVDLGLGVQAEAWRGGARRGSCAKAARKVAAAAQPATARMQARLAARFSSGAEPDLRADICCHRVADLGGQPAWTANRDEGRRTTSGRRFGHGGPPIMAGAFAGPRWIRPRTPRRCAASRSAGAPVSSSRGGPSRNGGPSRMRSLFRQGA